MSPTPQVTFTQRSGGGEGFAYPLVSLPNPKPAITTISPSTVTAGATAFVLTVNGTGFIAASVVNWNSSPRPTTFVSATQLQAGIKRTDVATAGTATVTVYNPAPGGGTSTGSRFTVS